MRSVPASSASFLATLIAATFVIYALTVGLPGDPTLTLFRARYGEGMPPIPEVMEAIKQETGFGQSITEQYVTWLGGVLRGNFGNSLVTQQPVFPRLMERLPTTLLLSLGSLLLALLLALPAGVAASRGKKRTLIAMAVTQLGISLPDYFLATGLMLAFAVQLRLLPVAGWGSPAAALLPLLTLAARPWATYTRLIITGLDETMRQDWIRTGRAKGLGEAYLLFRHALPNTLLPVVSLLGVSASGALASALVVEVVFAIPGVGRMLYEAINSRDIPVVQACLVVQISLAILANGAADIAAMRLNPTLRVGRRRNG